MTTKHTPGPWVFAPGRDETGQPAQVTTVAWCCDYVIGVPSAIPGGNYRDGDPSGDPEADARLIAAAPDLLAALRAAVEWAGPMGEAPVHARPMWFDEARAALAKAEGR